jgi:hypothetical protein
MCNACFPSTSNSFDIIDVFCWSVITILDAKRHLRPEVTLLFDSATRFCIGVPLKVFVYLGLYYRSKLFNIFGMASSFPFGGQILGFVDFRPLNVFSYKWNPKSTSLRESASFEPLSCFFGVPFELCVRLIYKKLNIKKPRTTAQPIATTTGASWGLGDVINPTNFVSIGSTSSDQQGAEFWGLP